MASPPLSASHSDTAVVSPLPPVAGSPLTSLQQDPDSPLQHSSHYYPMHYSNRPQDYQDDTRQAALLTRSSHTFDHSNIVNTTSSAATSPSQISQAPIKRKPLSSTASPLAVRFSSDSPFPPTFVQLPKPEQRFARSCSVDSPTLYEDPLSFMHAAEPDSSSVAATLAFAEPPASESRHIPVSDTDPVDAHSEHSDVLSEYDDLLSDLGGQYSEDATPTAEYEHSNTLSTDPTSTSRNSNPNPHKLYDRSSSMLAPRPTPPHLNLQTIESSSARTDSQSDYSSDTPQSTKLNKPLPKSPSQPSPFAALFGWGGQSPSVTDFSSIPSPATPARNAPSNDETRPANNQQHFEEGAKSHVAAANFLGYCESYLSTPPPGNATSMIQIDEMEDELKAISSELAASIRREMDLEDLVDRLQEQVNNPQAPGKRTSDYFSDSGYSSSKVSDYDQGKEEVEKVQRRAEQEKASIRLELTNKLQDERSQRKLLDFQIKELAEKASQIDLAQMNNLDATGRIRDLENSCEDLRRRLSEERSSKSNFEDLLDALKGQLQDACNERDNLRDEVVPQLRARVEGLETEAAEYANLTYESTKMQQELQSLKQQNTVLKRTSVMGEDVKKSRGFGLGLSRTSSIRNVQSESKEALFERLKDVEAQRDALHKALKALLDRQDHQNRENEKKISILESERQRLLSGSPKKAGFEKEISSLRTEINVLRRRAEDALEQKWQVEKGLSGLKMDLDRAEEEIASLRALLEEQDILIPPPTGRFGSPKLSSAVPVTSNSLQNAYKELQSAYTASLERIKDLENGSGVVASDEKTQLAMQRLERSLTAAVTERDAARQQADSFRSRMDSLSVSEAQNVESERALADELTESASRVEKLASQVQQQLAANSELRRRLSDAVARGEADRKANTDRITGLMERLRVLEDQLVTAQTASEERVTRHEEEISNIREAHNEQLRRMNSSPGLGGLRSPGLKSPRNPSLLGPGTSPLDPRSPRLEPFKSFEDEAEMKTLRAKVAELEKALAEAENEMQEVVAKMSAAQIEVMTLQEEREAAARETSRLQKTLEQEFGTPMEDRFRSIRSHLQS